MGQGTRTSLREAHAARKKHAIRTQREEDRRRHTEDPRDSRQGKGRKGKSARYPPKINVLMEQNEGGIFPLCKIWRQSRCWDKGAAGA